MAIVCKDCKVGIPIAKYYPLGGFMGGSDSKDNSGWYQQGDSREGLNRFFIKHKHNYDTSIMGGEQYFLGYESDDKDWKYAREETE